MSFRCGIIFGEDYLVIFREVDIRLFYYRKKSFLFLYDGRFFYYGFVFFVFKVFDRFIVCGFKIVFFFIAEFYIILF